MVFIDKKIETDKPIQEKPEKVKKKKQKEKGKEKSREGTNCVAYFPIGGDRIQAHVTFLVPALSA